MNTSTYELRVVSETDGVLRYTLIKTDAYRQTVLQNDGSYLDCLSAVIEAIKPLDNFVEIEKNGDIRKSVTGKELKSDKTFLLELNVSGYEAFTIPNCKSLPKANFIQFPIGEAIVTEPIDRYPCKIWNPIEGEAMKDIQSW
jgi:hypothetical protein